MKHKISRVLASILMVCPMVLSAASVSANSHQNSNLSGIPDAIHTNGISDDHIHRNEKSNHLSRKQLRYIYSSTQDQHKYPANTIKRQVSSLRRIELAKLHKFNMASSNGFSISRRLKKGIPSNHQIKNTNVKDITVVDPNGAGTHTSYNPVTGLKQTTRKIPAVMVHQIRHQVPTEHTSTAVMVHDGHIYVLPTHPKNDPVIERTATHYTQISKPLSRIINHYSAQNVRNDRNIHSADHDAESVDPYINSSKHAQYVAIDDGGFHKLQQQANKKHDQYVAENYDNDADEGLSIVQKYDANNNLLSLLNSSHNPGLVSTQEYANDVNKYDNAADGGYDNHTGLPSHIEYYPEIERNFRGLGGYRTADGKYEIKPKMIFRSNRLHHLSSAGIKKLHQLGVNTFIDLRTHHQIKHKPDVGEDGYGPNIGVNVVHDGMFTNRDKKADNAIAREQHMDTLNHYRLIYDNLLVNNRNALNSYRNTFNILQHKNGGVVFHCNGGKDRTGATSILLLSALGMSKKSIVNDYLRTSIYDRTSMYDMLREVDTFYGSVDRNYGSMHNFLHYGVGLTNHDINQLRSKYLEPVK